MNEKKRAYLRSFGSSFNITKASKDAGVTRQTIYNWQREDKEFSQMIEAINQGFVDVAESVLYDIIQNSYKVDKNGDVIIIDGKKQRSKEALDAAKFVLSKSKRGKERGYADSIDINADIRAMQTKLEARDEIIDVTAEQMKQLTLEKLKNG